MAKLPLKQFRVKQLRNPKIDWGHPLTNSLIACYMPGYKQGHDLACQSPTLAFQANASLGSDADGPGLAVSASGSSGMTAIASPALISGWTKFSILWRGYIAGTPSNNISWAGITYDNAASSPFHVADVGLNGSGFNTIDWNGGGNFAHAGGTIPVLTGDFSTYIGTFDVNGNVNLYVNGVLDPSTPIAWNVAGNNLPPTTTATSTVEINEYIGVPTRFGNASCDIACFWTRVLNSDEVTSLTVNPYQFIIPPEAQMPSLFLSPFSALVMNRADYDWGRASIIGY